MMHMGTGTLKLIYADQLILIKTIFGAGHTEAMQNN